VSRKYFGTDGIRGVANAKLTPELAFELGQAAGKWLVANKQIPRAVIGRDTRRSGPMLGAALAAGLNSVGVSVEALGVVPTPTVSFAARKFDFGLGVVISASHNPAPDNGIKLLGHDGRKLSDEAELEIENLMETMFEDRPTGANVGWLGNDRTSIEAYMDYLSALVPERLDGMKVAVDAAHGAAFELGPQILVRLGAEVFVKGAEPDGMNINEEGGATKPQSIQDFTVATGADVGVAFDGDADRAIFSDEQGRLINGDRTMGIWSSYWQSQGRLDPSVVIGTVMSNGGFEQYLAENGIELVRAPVGDKYVSQLIEARNARIGGEQSGHIIFPQNGPTGDGLATMLELLRVFRLSGRPASSFYNDFEPWPQLLINVSVESKDGWQDRPRIKAAIEQAETELKGTGRLNVRASGTQPMIRVMVEANESTVRDRLAQSILEAFEAEVGGKVYSKVDLTYALGD
jgi:phosphoglucosamine mutase